MTMKAIVLAAAVSVSASAASADGLYFGGSVGKDSSEGTYITTAESPRSARLSKDKLKFGEVATTAYVGTRGFSITKNTSIGVELSYTIFKAGDGHNVIDEGYNHGRMDIKQAMDAKLMLFYAPKDKWTLFAGAGVSRGTMSQRYSFVTNTVHSGTQEYTVNGIATTLGAEYALTDDWSLRGEITHREHGGGGSGETLTTWGKVHSTFSSSSSSSTSASIGLTWSF